MTCPMIARVGWRTLSACRDRALPILLTLAIAIPAFAQKPENLTAGEIALLPAYCPDTMGFRPGVDEGWMVGKLGPNAMRWVSVMGEKSFRTMHHFCWALVNERRASAAGLPGQERERLFKRVVADAGFVVQHSEPNFVMLPEVFSKIGDANVRLNNFGAAFEAYAAAIQRKPDYWLPYSRWAEALNAYKNREAALKKLEEGMRAASNQAPLRQQYKGMGGNLEKFLPTLPPKAVALSPLPASAPEAAALPASAPSH